MRPYRLAALALAATGGACGAAGQRASAPHPTASATMWTFPDAGAPAEFGTDGGDTGANASVEALGASSPTPAGSQPESAASNSSSTGACNDQAPQDFLIRGNFLRAGQQGLQRAIQYRTDTYGYFAGFGRAASSARPPSSYVVSMTFMDLPVRMHQKVVPALKCVEEEIKRACADRPYTPHALAGVRFRNTYRGGEVTNHIYGIAIDIDPGINTCCGCVKPWNEAPACKRPAKTEYDRMSMPECWVHAFERYGFYWLGHDTLRDTMHFEFLGDPEQIVKTAIAPGQSHGDGGT
jgi:hypothetical protein